MPSKISLLADRALGRVVPKIEAAAACEPWSFYQYECVEHLKYRRLCTHGEACTTTCGAWVSYARC